MIKFTVNTGCSVDAVHFYYIQIEEKNILIDTGPFSEETKRIFINYIDLLKLDYVFLTHLHVDHSGMIKFISKK
jgi:glyoxylase-like metal-dependent hydrolase (beta-lactamase superfamily II)